MGFEPLTSPHPSPGGLRHRLVPRRVEGQLLTHTAPKATLNVPFLIIENSNNLKIQQFKIKLEIGGPKANIVNLQ